MCKITRKLTSYSDYIYKYICEEEVHRLPPGIGLLVVLLKQFIWADSK